MKNKKPMGKTEVLFEFTNGLLLFLVALIMFYPFWHELCLSFSSSHQAARGGIFLLPREFTLEAYQIVVKNQFIWSSYANSIFTTVITTFIGVLFSAMLAYPLSKSKLHGNRVLSFLVVFAMIFNGGLIPTYLVVKSLGLINSLWSLILLAAVTPYNLIIMRNFFQALPEEIEEAAFIDGANPLRIFFVIIMPLSKAVMATVALWLAVGQWNNFMNALVYLNDRAKYTLPIYIRQVIDGQMLSRLTGEGGQTAVESVIAATIMLTVLPIIAIYPFLQKYFVKGVMVGSVKG